MPMTGIQSQIIGASQPSEETAQEAGRDPNDPLDFSVPNMGQTVPGTEVHQFEFTPNGGNGVVLSLALTIKPGHGGVNPATPSGSASARSHTSRGDDTMAGEYGKNRFGGYKASIAERFLADVDLFLTDNRQWGEISLLQAGSTDHRLFARLRSGEGFRIDSLERVAETMNQAEAGKIVPETYREKRRKAAGKDGGSTPATEGGPDDRQPDESDD